MDKQNFRNKITIANFMMSCCIVATHIYIDDYAGIYSIKESMSFTIQKIFIQTLQGPITAICLSLFYAMSAFLFYYNLSSDNLVRKLKSRVKTLVIPYLLWNAIGFLFFFTIGNAAISELPEYVLFAKNNPTYFMGIIAFYTCFAPVLWKILKHKYIGALIVVVALWVSMSGINIVISEMNYMNFITASIPNLCYYTIGAYIGLHGKQMVTTPVKNRVLTVLISIVVFIVCCVGYQYFYQIRPVLRIIGMVSVWLAFDGFKLERTPINICKCSFVIYCSHIIFNGIYYKVLKLVCPPFTWFPIVSTVLIAMLSIVTIYYGFEIVRKFMPRIAGILSGSRS